MQLSKITNVCFWISGWNRIYLDGRSKILSSVFTGASLPRQERISCFPMYDICSELGVWCRGETVNPNRNAKKGVCHCTRWPHVGKNRWHKSFLSCQGCPCQRNQVLSTFENGHTYHQGNQQGLPRHRIPSPGTRCWQCAGNKKITQFLSPHSPVNKIKSHQSKGKTRGTSSLPSPCTSVGVGWHVSGWGCGTSLGIWLWSLLG